MFEDQEVRKQLGRILSSRWFTASERLTRFLQFIVAAALENRLGELKEYTIGLEVFDRPATYDPRLEPIVRVEARRLRSKLQKYYENEGVVDELIVEIPKGSYAPLFRQRGETAGPAAPEPDAITIGVLPFANIAPDGENEYFSDGLTEELIHALTRVEGLRVVAWPSMYQFKGRSRNPRDVGEQLGVTHILDGGVRRIGDRCRVTAQLIDIASGLYLWSESYDREMSDVFALQDEIARKIVAALRMKLDPPPQIKRAQSPEAQEFYLKGRHLWNTRNYEKLHQAVDCFERAIAADPHFAAAWAGLADACNVIGQTTRLPWHPWLTRARDAARHALDLDESLAEAHVSLGSLHAVFDWDWKSANRHFDRAIQLNPGYATARHWRAYDILAPAGRLDEALAEVELALELDPLSAIMGDACGAIHFFRREFEESVECYREVDAMHREHPRRRFGLVRSLVQVGEFGEALAILEGLEPDDAIAMALLGHAYAAAGQRERALAVMQTLRDRSRTCFVPAFAFGRLYCGLGCVDEAFEWFFRTAGERDAHLMHLRVSPIFDLLRGDERYPKLLAAAGLSDADVNLG